MLDYESNRPCGITSEMLEGVVSPKESVTLSSKPTSKSSFAQRKYPHTPEQIAKELRVDEDGNLWWRCFNGTPRKMNRPVGTIKDTGYKVTKLDKYLYRNSALAWCLYYGRWPLPEIEINGTFNLSLTVNLYQADITNLLKMPLQQGGNLRLTTALRTMP